MVKVVVDIHGGDKSPKELLPGVIEALEKNDDLELVVAGNEEIIKSYLEEVNYSNPRLSILSCTQEVTNYDSPTAILKEKKDSSLVKGINFKRINKLEFRAVLVEVDKIETEFCFPVSPLIPSISSLFPRWL